MTQNPNSPQYTPDVPQWIAGSQEPPTAQHPGGQQAFAGQPPAGATTAAGAPTSSASLPGGAIGAQPTGSDQGAAAEATGKSRWKSSDGKPTGLALAGAGSLLAVLAFLGGTAVGHAWGGTTGTDQTQFGGPGGGRFRQFPGQTQGGTGTVPGQGGTGQNGTGQNGTGQNGTGQGTLPSQGNQQGQGTVPGTQPSTGTQDSGQQQLPGQTQSSGMARTT